MKSQSLIAMTCAGVCLLGRIGYSQTETSASQWQGEWGQWKEVNDRTDQGGYLSIQDCSADAKTCRIRYESAVSSPSLRCSGDGLVIIDSAAAGRIEIWSASFGHKDCSIELRMKTGNPPRIHAKQTGRDCSNWCVGDAYFAEDYPIRSEKGDLPVYLAETYALRSRKAYWPTNNSWHLQRCYEDSSQAAAAWCTDSSLRSMHALWTDTLEQASRLDPWSDSESEMDIVWRTIRACVTEADAPRCLIQSYQTLQAKAEETKMRAQAVRRQWQRDLSEPASKEDARVLIGRIAGGYWERARKTIPAEGDEYDPANVIEIVKVAPDVAYFYVWLSFAAGHSCEISGLAEVKRIGGLVFGDASPEPTEDKSCTLLIRPIGDKLRLEDPDASCSAYCGARGSLDGAEFKLSSRSRIRYMKQLKNSTRYKEAVKDIRMR